MVKDVNGQILRDGVEVKRRWEEYFEQVLNVEDVTEAITNVRSWQLADASVGSIEWKSNIDKGSKGAVKEIKSDKVPGLDGFPVKWLKKVGMAVLEWWVRLLNVRYMGFVPLDWRGTCIAPLYKKKGDKCECCNSSGISLFC